MCIYFCGWKTFLNSDHSAFFFLNRFYPCRVTKDYQMYWVYLFMRVNVFLIVILKAKHKLCLFSHLFSCCRRPLQLKIRQKRQTMQNMTRPLKQWLCRNRDNPYPSKLEKEILARDSQMTNTQVSNWFANARRRLKNAVKGDNIPWSTRVKKYNSSVPGNAELLSISSDDSSLFDSDDNGKRAWKVLGKKMEATLGEEGVIR